MGSLRQINYIFGLSDSKNRSLQQVDILILGLGNIQLKTNVRDFLKRPQNKYMDKR